MVAFVFANVKVKFSHDVAQVSNLSSGLLFHWLVLVNPVKKQTQDSISSYLIIYRDELLIDVTQKIASTSNSRT